MPAEPLSAVERAELLRHLLRNFADGTAILVDGVIYELTAEEYLEYLERQGEARARLRWYRYALERTKFYPRGVWIRLDDINIGLGEPVPGRTHAARPRERRARATTRNSRSAGGDGPSDEPPPPDVAHLRGFVVASVRMVQHLERRRAKAAMA
jgi:hypothetical protein